MFRIYAVPLYRGTLGGGGRHSLASQITVALGGQRGRWSNEAALTPSRTSIILLFQTL